MVFALHVLVAAGQLVASARPLGRAEREPAADELESAAAITPGRVRLAQPFNRHMLASRAVGSGGAYLASPGTGSAIALSESSSLAVYALQEAGAREKPEDWLHGFLAAKNKHVRRNGVEIKDPPRARAYLRTVINRESLKVVPKLRRLGLVEDLPVALVERP